MSSVWLSVPRPGRAATTTGRPSRAASDGHVDAVGEGHERPAGGLHHDEVVAGGEVLVGADHDARVEAHALQARGLGRGERRPQRGRGGSPRSARPGRCRAGDELGVAGDAAVVAGLGRLQRGDGAALGAGAEGDRGGHDGLPHPGVGAHHEDAALVEHQRGHQPTARRASAPRAQSMWRSSWVAITVRRMRAVPTGTEGGRMAGAQTRAARSDAPHGQGGRRPRR